MHIAIVIVIVAIPVLTGLEKNFGVETAVGTLRNHDDDANENVA